jgi:hypothetical protein
MIAVFVSHVGVHRLGVSNRALPAPEDTILSGPRPFPARYVLT